MTTLSRSLLHKNSALPAGLACGPLTTFPERIVQFGEGNFLRAFADWMIDELNSRGLLQSQVLVVQPIRQGLAAQLNAQDGLYTVLVRGTENGQVVESPRVVTAVRRALDPYASWAELVATFESNDLRFVLSNTTEAGISYSAEPFDPAKCPESFPAKIASLLYARFQVVRGHPERGLVFVPCELIEKNGSQLRECVLKHAQAWALSAEFVKWIGESNVFLNTLVDRIVPGYPKAEAADLAKKFSYQDNLIVASEHFHLWVIEGPREIEAELPFARAGLNVVWTDDLTPYRSRKVRVLNGAHTGSVLAAYAAGATTVNEMMDDELTAAFVYRLVFDEIVPCLAQPAEERRAYAEAVLERFRNPFVRHELLSISLNSISKWKVRVLPSLLDAIAARRAVPPLLSFSLAALLWFYRGHREPDGRMLGRRGDEKYPIRDDEAVLDFFAREWALVEETGDRFQFTKNALAQVQFWGRDLNEIPGLNFSIAIALERIASLGMRETLKKLVVETPRS